MNRPGVLYVISSGQMGRRSKLACYRRYIWTSNRYEEKRHATEESGTISEYLLRIAGAQKRGAIRSLSQNWFNRYKENMRNLIDPHNTIEFLKTHGISAKKRYGQNFLIDRRVLDRIIEGAGITKEDIVLEIGPGIGTLTQALCEAAAYVIAVEIDRDMIPLLEENLAEYDNYRIINEDVLKVDPEALIREMGFEGRTVRVAANLPYYITTPIIMQLLESGLPAKTITVMVQKEVADRMQAAPGTPDYGALSLAVQYYADARISTNVPPNCFIPRPNVDSAVITLERYETPPVEVRNEKYMFHLIRASFAQRRKTLANSLKNDPSLGLSRGQIEDALARLDLPADIRGERLSLQQFAALSDLLQNHEPDGSGAHCM